MKKITQWLITEKGILFLLVILSFSGIFDHDLWEPHEYRVAGIAHEMAASRNFIVPHLAGRPFVEKPPLFFALLAGSYLLTGWNAARLFRFLCALFSLGTLLVVYITGKKIFSEKQKSGPVISMVILGTCLGFLRLSHFIILDTLLALFVTCAYGAFIYFLLYQKRRYIFLFYVSMAGAFLTKGFIGPLFILAGIGFYILFSREWGFIRSFIDIPGLLFFICVVLAWVIPFYLWDSGGVFDRWFWDQHFGRFSGTSYGHKQVSGEAIMQLAINLLPWTLAIIAVPAAFFHREKTNNRPFFSLKNPWMLIIGWALGGIGMLSLSRSFRSIYLLPLYPAFALLTGFFLSLRIKSGFLEKIWLQTVWFLYLSLFLVFVLAWGFILQWRISYLFLLIMGGTGFVLYHQIKHAFWQRPMAMYAGTLIFFSSVIALAFPVLEHYKSAASSIAGINRVVPENSHCVSWEFTESLEGIIPLYTGRFIFNIEEPSFYDPDRMDLKGRELSRYLEARHDIIVLDMAVQHEEIISCIVFPEILFRYIKNKKNMFVITSSKYYKRIRPRLKFYGWNLKGCLPHLTLTSEHLCDMSRLIFSWEEKHVLKEEDLLLQLSSPFISFQRIPFYPNRQQGEADYIHILKKI